MTKDEQLEALKENLKKISESQQRTSKKPTQSKLSDQEPALSLSSPTTQDFEEELLKKYRSEVDTKSDKTFDKRTKEDAEIDDLDSWVELRGKFAEKIYWLLTAEIIFIMLVVLLAGFELITLNEWVLGAFISGVLAHTFSLVHVIVKNLFDKNK